jgi:serine/threonine-protein kinase RsbW
MQPAEVWDWDDRATGWRLGRPTCKSILVQREVSAPVVMTSAFVSFILTLRSLIRSRTALQLEVLALRHQLQVLERAELIEVFGAAHGLSPEVVFKLNLALDEVVTNIISHAYDDEDEHQIAIRVALDGEGRLRARGRRRPSIQPLDAPRPDLGLDLAERPIGGLRVHIVRSVMDALEYRREDDRNILIMRKRTGDAGSNEEARRIE